MFADLSLSPCLSRFKEICGKYRRLLSLRPRPQQCHARHGTKEHLKLSRSSPRHTRGVGRQSVKIAKRHLKSWLDFYNNN